jgi:hypothetical protein
MRSTLNTPRRCGRRVKNGRVSASDATPSLLPMNMLEISTRWAKGEVVQGRIMMVAGIGFTLAAILILDHHTSLIRGFAGPAVLIVLALCGYGANLMFSRPAEINRFVVAYEADAAAFRVSERQRFLDLRTSFARNQIIWAGLSVPAAVAAFLVSSPTYVSLALGMLLATIIAFAIDTALALRAKRALQQLAALQ